MWGPESIDQGFWAGCGVFHVLVFSLQYGARKAGLLMTPASRWSYALLQGMWMAGLQLR